MSHRAVLICLIAFFQSTAIDAQQTPADKIVASVAEKLRAAKVDSGLIVTSIARDGAGDRAGLKLGDLIVKLNGDTVSDAGSFANLRDKYRGTVSTFTVWRDGQYITTTPIVLPAAVNISGSDWSYLMAQILFRLDAGDVDTVGTLVQQAEENHSLSPKDLLIVKLLVLPGEAPGPGSDQDKLTRELTNMLTPNESIAPASLLQTHGRPWPAIPLHRKIVASAPEDVSKRLNFASLLADLEQNDEAEKNVHYILDRTRPGLSAHGFHVAERVLGVVAGNREDWQGAYDHNLRSLKYESDFDTEAQARNSALRHLNIAAHLRDIDVFRQARSFALSFGGKGFAEWTAFVDALEAYVLVAANHKDDARELVNRWKDKPEWKRVYDYWAGAFPQCAQSWKTLAER